MKKTMIIVATAIALAACHKDNDQPPGCSNPETAFAAQLQGTYEQVGFKSDLFPDWSYTSSGPQFTISSDSITDPFSTKYQVMDQNTFYMINQNQLVDVAFGDTVLFSFQNGDSSKLVKL